MLGWSRMRGSHGRGRGERPDVTVTRDLLLDAEPVGERIPVLIRRWRCGGGDRCAHAANEQQRRQRNESTPKSGHRNPSHPRAFAGATSAGEAEYGGATPPPSVKPPALAPVS